MSRSSDAEAKPGLLRPHGLGYKTVAPVAFGYTRVVVPSPPPDPTLPDASRAAILPVVVLDYHRRPALADRFRGDAGLLLTSAAIMGLLGLVVAAGLVRLLVTTWPDFGVALIAVPVGLIALAFWSVAYGAVRAWADPNAAALPPEN